MNPPGKPSVWLRGEIKTPPFTPEARVEAGHLLRLVQLGWKLSMPHSRPMPAIGPRIADIFAKTTRSTPDQAIAVCKGRLRMYDEAK